MANTGFKGIDVRQTGTALLFRAFLQDSAGAIVTGGTTSLYLYELQSDATLKSYDFNDNTFKTTALTTETLAMTHRTGNNGGTNTGLWSIAQSTLTGFTVGAIYFARVKNTGASPTDQVREFQFGSAEGDLVTTANGTGIAELNGDVVFWKGSTAPSMTGDAYASATTILNRIGAWTGTGRNTILGWAQSLFRKDADATVPSDINTNLGGGAGAADNTTDSLEAQRDNVGALGASLSAVPKTGFKLASDGLDLIVPADPSNEPILGTSSLVVWIGYFGAWSVNEVRSDSDSVNLRNTANNGDIAAYATSDTGTLFTSGAAT